jgi:hypothetical protein
MKALDASVKLFVEAWVDTLVPIARFKLGKVE